MWCSSPCIFVRTAGDSVARYPCHCAPRDAACQTEHVSDRPSARHCAHRHSRQGVQRLHGRVLSRGTPQGLLAGAGRQAELLIEASMATGCRACCREGVPLLPQDAGQIFDQTNTSTASACSRNPHARPAVFTILKPGLAALSSPQPEENYWLKDHETMLHWYNAEPRLAMLPGFAGLWSIRLYASDRNKRALPRQQGAASA